MSKQVCSNSLVRSQSPGRQCEFRAVNMAYNSGSADCCSLVTFLFAGVAATMHGVDSSSKVLAPLPQFVAIVPDDMLAVQELHTAREGMDSESIFPSCSARGIQPIVTSSTAQRYGEARRLIWFFCQSCCSMHDKVELAPMPPLSPTIDL